LRSYGRMRSIGQSSIRSTSVTSPALCCASVKCEPRGANLGTCATPGAGVAAQNLRDSVAFGRAKCDGAVRTSSATGATPGSHPSQPKTQGIPPFSADSDANLMRRVQRSGSHPVAFKTISVLRLSGRQVRRMVRSANPASRPVASEISRCAPPYQYSPRKDPDGTH
jgi:hypothetical protein